MSSIFQKINAFVPRLQRPLKAVKTKLAGFAPVVATKKFLFKKAAAIAKPFVRLYVGASKRYRNLRLPTFSRRNALEREVGKQIFKRDVKAADVEKAMTDLGKARGTKEQAEEARRLMDSMLVVQKELEKYAVAAEASEEALDKHLGIVDEMLADKLVNLKNTRWKDYQSRIRGKSNSRIIHFQSLHQLVFGTDHLPVRDRTTARLEGLRHYVREAQVERHHGNRQDTDTDLEYAMKKMREDWKLHRAPIDGEIQNIIGSKDRSKTRRLQHLMAYRATIKMLDEVLDAPDTNIARQARENLVSEMGDMLGLKETLSSVDTLLREEFPDTELPSGYSERVESAAEETETKPPVSPEKKRKRPAQKRRSRQRLGVRLDPGLQKSTNDWFADEAWKRWDDETYDPGKPRKK
ncbi:hypothetical protein NX722_02770 [Endozoicomonas gorgoniicola]|uniref:CHAD domain-containing protein n=1 Tax=Endozoicomonas gorgoniicola TaxID=1234144 RepID=A0ABT3MQD0_9GAMM|nr:hypothetical protein [Endozoicomonas gorgoniicola]MCW7551585.1 hypothetical protein [Endozoicomonas gorgoniicola]